MDHQLHLRLRELHPIQRRLSLGLLVLSLVQVQLMTMTQVGRSVTMAIRQEAMA